MNNYGKVTKGIIEKIEGVVGEENTSIGEEEYARDETCLLEPCPPDIVAKPKNAEEISSILKLANEVKIPVTPRGSGTGLSAGAVPIYNGILLSLERMNQILEIDEENFTATVEPGVTLSEIYEAVENKNLYYPLYPGEESASIGGNVATNAGGMKAVKYGVTRDYVLGLEAVLPTGQIIETGGKYVKSSTGYDLRHLIAGSEGTLAVITKIILKLETLPQKKGILIAPFGQLQQGIETVPDILKRKITPTGIEFMEKIALDLGQEHTGINLPLPESDAYLIIMLEAEGKGEMREIIDEVSDVLIENGADDVYLPSSEKERKDVLEVREKMFYAIQELGPVDIADVVVPRKRIPEFMGKIKETSEKHNILMGGSGHAGDGNVHISAAGMGMDEEKFKNKSSEAFKDIFRAGVSLGGTISGEHGLGSEKKDYLPIAMEKGQIELMKRIKSAFDPNGILNPGKIFPQD